MGTLRTDESMKRYATFIEKGGLGDGCKLCEKESLRSFIHWRIVSNDFPYDKIASVHTMIIPNRHVGERELSSEERTEFEIIKDTYLHNTYEYIIEATYKKKTIPAHFHMHLIITKD